MLYLKKKKRAEGSNLFDKEKEATHVTSRQKGSLLVHKSKYNCYGIGERNIFLIDGGGNIIH